MSSEQTQETKAPDVAGVAVDLARLAHWILNERNKYRREDIAAEMAVLALKLYPTLDRRVLENAAPPEEPLTCLGCGKRIRVVSDVARIKDRGGTVHEPIHMRRGCAVKVFEQIDENRKAAHA